MGSCTGSTKKHEVNVQINYHSLPNQNLCQQNLPPPSRVNYCYQQIYQKPHPPSHSSFAPS